MLPFSSVSVNAWTKKWPGQSLTSLWSVPHPTALFHERTARRQVGRSPECSRETGFQFHSIAIKPKNATLQRLDSFMQTLLQTLSRDYLQQHPPPPETKEQQVRTEPSILTCFKFLKFLTQLTGMKEWISVQVKPKSNSLLNSFTWILEVKLKGSGTIKRRRKLYHMACSLIFTSWLFLWVLLKVNRDSAWWAWSCISCEAV